MSNYDQYYLSENLFGKPYPELVSFFESCERGTVLDLGCGQGRDVLFLAELGFTVTGVDSSKVGISQMLSVSKKRGLKVKGQIADMYEWSDFATYDYVLLNSMFHFEKNDKENEVALINKICENLKEGGVIVFCIQDTGKKVPILEKVIVQNSNLVTISKIPFIYSFKDEESGHSSKTNYQLISVQK